MAAMLGGRGFKAADTTVLTDAAATKPAIMARPHLDGDLGGAG